MITKYKHGCSNQGQKTTGRLNSPSGGPIQSRSRRYVGDCTYEPVKYPTGAVQGVFRSDTFRLELHKWFKKREDGAKFFLVDPDQPTRYKEGFVSNINGSLQPDSTAWFGYDGFYTIDHTDDGLYHFNVSDTRPDKRSK